MLLSSDQQGECFLEVYRHVQSAKNWKTSMRRVKFEYRQKSYGSGSVARRINFDSCSYLPTAS
jgi:hypothetical protein